MGASNQRIADRGPVIDPTSSSSNPPDATTFAFCFRTSRDTGLSDNASEASSDEDESDPESDRPVVSIHQFQSVGSQDD